MLYREVGRTGKKAGIIGLGGEHLDNKPYEQVESTIHTALDCGMNVLDIFMPGKEVRENIQKALGSRRKDFYLQAAIGSTDVKQQYDISRDLPTVKKYFEECLRMYGYIDFGMLFFIDSQEDFDKVFDGGIADYALKLKQNGDIHHIGFSSHKPDIATKTVKTGIVEVMMFSINLAFDLSPNKDIFESMTSDWQGDNLSKLDPERTYLYELCESMGVGISVMKTLGAGKLISPEHTPFKKPMSINQCIHYALDRPAVFSVLLGCQTEEQIKDAIKYFEATSEEKDYSEFLYGLESSFEGKCVYCNHCLPCPAEIDIAMVNKYLDIAKLDEHNIPPSIRAHYRNLSATGEDCIECGNCEIRCPFGVSIIENMKTATRMLVKA